ncbi:unnamed protein product [Merluccius merluccius]
MNPNKEKKSRTPPAPAAPTAAGPPLISIDWRGGGQSDGGVLRRRVHWPLWECTASPWRCEDLTPSGSLWTTRTTCRVMWRAGSSFQTPVLHFLPVGAANQWYSPRSVV